MSIELSEEDSEGLSGGFLYDPLKGFLEKRVAEMEFQKRFLNDRLKTIVKNSIVNLLKSPLEEIL